MFMIMDGNPVDSSRRNCGPGPIASGAYLSLPKDGNDATHTGPR